MTPKMRQDFEARWPALARRVDLVLRRKGLDEPTRDDITQETAVRLIQMWDRVDVERAQVLAVTIALNVMRDDARRKRPDLVDQVPEIECTSDVERAGLARLELGRVRAAMSHLSAAQRSALLREVGDAPAAPGTGDADKMLRMRARKKLRAALGRISAPVLLRLRKLGDAFHIAGAGGTEGLVQGMGVVGCLLVGLMIAVPVGTPGTAKAAPADVEAEALRPATRADRSRPDAAELRRTWARNREAVDRQVKNRVVSTGRHNERARGKVGAAKKAPKGSPDESANAPEAIVDAPDLPVAQPEAPVNPEEVTESVPGTPQEAEIPATVPAPNPELPDLPTVEAPAAARPPAK